jgi:hypothetical protein
MKIDLVLGDDWVGLYCDGELEMENHSLDVYHVLKLLADKGLLEGFKGHVSDEEWLEERGCLPESLSEVKLADEV